MRIRHSGTQTDTHRHRLVHRHVPDGQHCSAAVQEGDGGELGEQREEGGGGGDRPPEGSQASEVISHLRGRKTEKRWGRKRLGKGRGIEPS